jgi:hypothetical protein
VITATFNGATGWLSSSGNSPTQVVQDGTLTTVGSSPNPANFGQSVTFTATITGAHSGTPTGSVTFTEGGTVLASNVTVDGSGHASFGISTLGVGSHVITAFFTGTNGWLNSSGNSSAQSVQDGTNTTVSSSPNPSTFGQSVTFTATVVAADTGAGVPAGSVTFTEGSTVLASGVAVDSGGHAAFSTSALPPGGHVITASFTGTTGWQPSSGNSSSQVVNEATGTTVVSSPNPSPFGAPVTFAATVSAVDSGAGVPVGTVTFTEGATVLASGIAVDGSGHASFTTSTLGVGSHTITATFTGNVGWQTSSGSSAAQVVQNGTNTSVSGSPNPANFEQSVTFTALVTAADPMAGTPTGAVTFTESGTVLAANVPLDSSGHASFTTSSLGAGNHIITATFSSGSGWQGSSGDSPALLVQDGTSTALTSSGSPSDFGQLVTFTASVTPAHTGAGAPGGSVAFADGASALATVTVDSTGHATFSTTSLAMGMHTITATFTGTAGWGSSSASIDQDINEETTTAISTNPTTSNFGQPVTFTATVAVENPAAGTPTGNVTFTEGAILLAVVAVDGSGHAVFTTSVLSVGNHDLMASFAGTGGYEDSSGTSGPILVQDGTNTTVIASPTVSAFGQAVTFTATIAAADAGAGIPAGTVTFTEGATVLASGVSVDASGHAGFTSSALSVGGHTITATFTGTAGWLTSAGNAALTVNRAGTSTAVSTSANPSVFGQSITLTATVTVVSPGSGAPTGTVTFLDGTTTLGTGTLDGTGHAQFTTSGLAVGSHSITATYDGSGNFNSSTSAALTQTVNRDGTTTVLVSSVNPSQVGQPVTFTATVTANAPGSGTPSGTVTFKDKNNVMATVSLNSSGTASFTTSTLSQGTHNISATYTGDSNFLTSVSNTVNQTVKRNGPKIARAVVNLQSAQPDATHFGSLDKASVEVLFAAKTDTALDLGAPAQQVVNKVSSARAFQRKVPAPRTGFNVDLW